MENETGFDLERAIANWRNELAAEPGITDDNVRELESHLREAIARQIDSGATAQAALDVVLIQIGSPEQTAAEHAKENVRAVWRDRLFWMALAATVLPAFMDIGMTVCSYGSNLARHTGRALPEFGLFRFLEVAVSFLQLLCVALPVVVAAPLVMKIGAPVRTALSGLVSRPLWLLALVMVCLVSSLKQYFGILFVGNITSSFEVELVEHGISGTFSGLLLRIAAIVLIFTTRPQRIGLTKEYRNSKRIWWNRTIWMLRGWITFVGWQLFSLGANELIASRNEPLWLNIILGCLLPIVVLATLMLARKMLRNAPHFSVLGSKVRNPVSVLVAACCLSLLHFWAMSAHDATVHRILVESGAASSISITTPIMGAWLINVIAPFTALFLLLTLRPTANTLRPIIGEA